jgi:iron complex transport system substrate-binding protein
MRILGTLVALVLLVCEASTAQKPPQRIISVIPAITEMLFALGAGDRVVAVGSFDKYPPDVEKLPRVGALLDPDLERILSLRPDLVAIYGSQADLRKQLDRAGVPVFVYQHAGLSHVRSTITELGQRIGATDSARQLVREIDRRLDEVKRGLPQGPGPRTLIVMSRDSFSLRGIYASGGVGFIHDMVTAAGGTNVFADVQKEAVQATTELIIARRPELIIELRAEPLSTANAAKERTVWNALASVPAVRNGRIHIITDRRTVIPGPRVGEGVEVISQFLYRR